MKTALITGITGQDGSYLSELLLQKGYKVIGLVSTKYNIGWENVNHLRKDLILEEGDLLDKNSLERIFKKHKIHETYNLAGISFVPACWDNPQLAFDINALGVLRLLEIIRDFSSKTKIYQASSAKIFGKPKSSPQNEETSINPDDPYGISKAAANFMVQTFRKNYDLFAVCGILYNHESLRRGEEFVTRKITLGAAKIKLGRQKNLKLGNLKSQADWGWAPDYVQAIYLMLQQKKPADFVIATGKLHSVEDVCRIAFGSLDLDYKKYIVRDKMFFRPQSGVKLCGNPALAKKILGWQPAVSFEEMIKLMVLNDLKILKKGDLR